MKTPSLEFRVHMPNLLKEMLECNPSGSMLTVPVNIMRGLLIKLAERAAALDDPALNIIMLQLALYDVPPNDIISRIEAQQARIDDPATDELCEDEGCPHYGTPHVCISKPSDAPRPIESYIKDGAIVRVLLKHDHIDHMEDNPLHDSTEPFWTLGFNQYIDTGVDEWQFVGWSWEQDCFCETTGTPIAWLPLSPTPKD